MEIEANCNKYKLEIDDMGNVTIKRYRADYKLWVLVSFSTDSSNKLDKKVQLVLKEDYLNKQFKF